ncbi:hypothetical protein G6L37_35020 [Agrobacterium rubi]|nr:hypothetical protein [Agrobacterium rubi]NTF23782.1 hypothetical protein [Agrobacterium rubi]
MSYKIDVLNSNERAREKQKSRDRDQFRLDNGQVSGKELRRENSVFSSLPLHRFRMMAIGGKPLVQI